MNKKGELTSTQIIILVIAIIGFGIVLAALFLIDFGGYTEKDICKLSVLTRATSPEATQRVIPLKCKSSKICLTGSFFGGGCEEQFAGEENIEYVRVSGKNEIEEVIANSMFDCWSMMGEGKLDLFASVKADFGFESIDSTCVVCSRIAVDNDFALKNEVLLREIDINEYMRTHQIPGSSLTYLQAFTDRGVSSYVKSDEGAITKADELGEKSGLADTRVSEGQLAILFMQIKTTETTSVLKNLLAAGATGAGLAAVSPIGRPLAKIAKIVVVGTKGLALIPIAIAGVGLGAYASSNAKQGQLRAGMYCGDFASGESAKKGCSIVQGIPYDFRVVNSICGSIEGEL